jgi:hypothetical protein
VADKSLMGRVFENYEIRNMQSVRDVTYQLFRELGLTTFFGNVGSTEETFLKNFPSDFRFPFPHRSRHSSDETARI